jgi:hypothetical protein
MIIHFKENQTNFHKPKITIQHWSMESQANSGARQWGTRSAHVIYTDSVACSGAKMYPLYVADVGLLPVKAPRVPKSLLPSISKVIYTDDVPCTGSQMYPLVILPVLKSAQK